MQQQTLAAGGGAVGWGASTRTCGKKGGAESGQGLRCFTWDQGKGARHIPELEGSGAWQGQSWLQVRSTRPDLASGGRGKQEQGALDGREAAPERPTPLTLEIDPNGNGTIEGF